MITHTYKQLIWKIDRNKKKTTNKKNSNNKNLDGIIKMDDQKGKIFIFQILLFFFQLKILFFFLVFDKQQQHSVFRSCPAE